MIRIIAYLCLYIVSFSLFASPKAEYYQVDLIVFTHLQAVLSPSKQTIAPETPNYHTKNTIPLRLDRSSSMTPYHLLPRASSHLGNEFWALNRKPQYQVLFHYSWLEPKHHKGPLLLSPMHIAGWMVEGTINIEAKHFYLLHSDLFFSAPDSEQAPFRVIQKQALKPGMVYYLDHPQAGMIIRINPVV